MQLKPLICKYLFCTIIICIIATSCCIKCRRRNSKNLAEDQAILIKYVKKYMPVLTIDKDKFDYKRATEQYNQGLKDDDLHLNITDLITINGYPVEQHNVTTADDYHLTVFRIPGNGLPVFLMHGMESSSDDWVTTGKDRGLAYLLADVGHDVWLGNARGTHHSRSHASLSPDCKEFWDFCWDDIGRYDLPAMIDYILKLTNQKQLQYIGHSQGTTAFFVMCSEKPEYNKKISIMISLAASAWQKHAKSSLAQIFGMTSPILSHITSVFGYSEQLPRNEFTRTIIETLCGTPESAAILCTNILFLVNGFDYAQINGTYLPRFFAHIPGGSSSKQVIHYGQQILSGKFRRYDYGSIKNMKRYGSVEPPDYPVEKITARVVLFYAENDWFSQIADLKNLMNKLPNYELYRIPWKNFNHLDYLLANDVKTLVYDKVIMYLK